MGRTTVDLKSLIREFVETLTRRIRIERILLFGSFARNEAHDDSDLDLLVVSPDFGENALADMVLLRQCLPARDFDIDTIARTPEQIASAEPDSFLATILEEAITVYP